MPNAQRSKGSRRGAVEPPIDTLLVGALLINAERAGRCAQCRQPSSTRRILRTLYLPPSLNRREQAHLTSGDLTEAQVVDSYLQRLARRQLRGDLGSEQKMALCAACALRWLTDCLEHGPEAVKLPPDQLNPAAVAQAILAARALLVDALRRNTPLFVGVTWRIERGPDGRSQVTTVTHSGGPVAPQILLRAQSDLRRYATEVGQSIFREVNR